MLNITELEKLQKRYRLKSYIKYSSIFSTILIVVTITFFLTPKTDSKKQELVVQDIVQKEIKPKPPQVQKELSIVKEEKTRPKESKKLVLHPSFDFIQKINVKTEKPIIKEDIVTNLVQKEIQQKPEQKTQITQTNNDIKIQRQNTNKDIEHVLKRFENNKNPALSLFVAKKYYELGSYDKAYNYALITNDINNEIDESWLIFTKSMVKLNQKNKAIKLLQEYIKHSHSAEAKTLLDDIISGKFNEL